MKYFLKRLPLIKNFIIFIIILSLLSFLALTTFSCKLPSNPKDSKGPDSINTGPEESGLNIIKGSGNIKSIEIDVQDFNKITVSGEGVLIIEQGDAEGLVVETDDNLLEYVKATVSNKELKIENIIDNGDDLVPTDTIYYYLNVKDLVSLKLPGVVNVKSNNIELSNLELIMNGVSNVELIGEINSLNLIVEEIGSLAGRDLLSKECIISGNGTANIVISVQEKLDIAFKGTGSIKYIGNPEVNKDIGNLVNVEKIN